MNFRKLLTYLAVGTAAVIPFAGAQNPTILQGNYISNVFGQSNFILNPNAQTNVANVTVSSATVTRSTTTPLVATSEFNITTSTSTGYADWATRTFDAGMKNQNCEARFTYRGFSVGSTTVQIRQGSNTVAQLTLTASTDPRIASINFPCGDLSSATTLRVQQATASLTGTNELSGLYLGLATNLANVSQAEEAGKYTITGSANCSWTTNSSTFANFSADSDCNTATVTGAATTSAGKIPGATFSNLKPGKYMFVFSGPAFKEGNTIDSVMFRMGDGTTYSNQSWLYAGGANAYYMPLTLVFTTEYTTVTSPTIQLQGRSPTASNNASIYNSDSLYKFEIIAYRFPTSSELVVTPERQNTFAGIKGVASGPTNTVTSASWTKLTSSSTLTRTSYGKAKVETNNDYSITIENMPVGSYQISVTGTFQSASNGSGDRTVCFFGLANTATGGSQIAGTQASATGDSVTLVQYVITPGMQGVYQNTSVSNQTFFVQAYKASGTGSCSGYSDTTMPVTITVTPLDQPSNSALYVQGPVLGAQTGAAIPAGYVGEVKHSATTPGCGTAAQYNDGASIALTPGIWKVTAQAVLGLTTTATINNWIVFTGPTSGNSATWRSNDFNDYSISGISIVSIPAITQPLIVKYDGTNLSYFANGSFTGSTASASGTIYTKFYRNGGTCNTVTSAITAIRLN